ncbi:MAG: hypothetical protein ABFS86_11055 [Planctomycetota bacterium]
MSRCFWIVLVVAASFFAACGGSDEERIRSRVRGYFEALREGDREEIWDHWSRHRKNLLSELRLYLSAPRPVEPCWFFEFAREARPDITPEVASGMEDREFYLWLRAEDEGFEPPPLSEDAVVTITDDTAEIRDHDAKTVVYLRRESGAWKVDWIAAGEDYEGVIELETGPGGLEYSMLSVVQDLSRRFWYRVPLPTLPGSVELPEDGSEPFRVRIAVETDGRLLVREEPIAADALIEKLLIFAERERDMEHPLQPSRVQALLAVHREAKWSDALVALNCVSDFDVRIRNVALLTREESAYRRWAVAADVMRYLPKHRWPAPAFRLSIGGGPATDERLSGLIAALRARKEPLPESGVTVALRPDASSEAALRVLVAVAAAGVQWIHPVADGTLTREWTLDGEPLEPGPKEEIGKLGPIDVKLVFLPGR